MQANVIYRRTPVCVAVCVPADYQGLIRGFDGAAKVTAFTRQVGEGENVPREYDQEPKDEEPQHAIGQYRYETARSHQQSCVEMRG